MPADHHRSGDPLADRRADYAESYALDGDHAAAIDLMRQALEIAPRWALGRVRLAAFEEADGRTSAAVETLRAALPLDPDGRYGVQLKLAALGAAPVPDTAPPAFVEELFDQYAERFEQSLVERLGYRMPDILMEELRTACDPLDFAAALDLGCGTGLMGERLRPVVARLDGLDISTAMLRKAERKAIYDTLTAGDILDPTIAADSAYDLVAAADVLAYVGDLAPVFAGVTHRLTAGGLFAFSVEHGEGDAPFVVRPSLRYAHGAAPLAESLAAAGFSVLRWRECVARRDRGEDIASLAIVARFG